MQSTEKETDPTDRLETLLIHAGAEVDPATGAVTPPIHLATTYQHGPGGEDLHGFEYIREGHPTQTRLETALAAADGGEAALFFSSGLAAVASMLQALPEGSHLVFPKDVYHGVRKMVQRFGSRWGLTATAADVSDLAAVRAALRPETRLVWAETPSNPQLRITEIAALAELVHGHGAELLVDGTFATPILQRPLDLGADVVMHSATKYMGGHSDVLGGALIFRKAAPWHPEILESRHLLGPAASPFNAWLVLRGLRSMACRVERHAANALALAEALHGHPKVETVYYPGLPGHPGHEIARKQMKAFGGMVSVLVRGGREEAVEVASRLRLFTNATSLGGVESLVEHRASIEGPGTPTPQNLLRLSVGLEHADDLIADWKQALGE